MVTVASALALAKRFWPILAMIALLVVVALIYRAGGKSERAQADNERLEGNVKAERAKGVADEKAAETRLQDAQRANSEQAELKEAIANAPDDPTSRRAAYYACLARVQQARREGLDPASAGC